MAHAQHKVVIYHQPGDASVLQVEEQPIPKRGNGEVLVKQYSASVNPIDFKMRQTNKDQLPKVGWIQRGLRVRVWLAIDSNKIALYTCTCADSRR